MDKEENTIFFNLSNNNFTFYGMLMIFFVFMIMLLNFIRKEIRNYLDHHDRMKNIADTYERKRNSRKDLAVSHTIILKFY